MHSIFMYKFINHPTFHQGMILSNINQKIDSYVDVFFFDNKTIKSFRKSFILEKCEDIASLKLIDIISDDLIDLIFDDRVQTKGKKYISDSRININSINDYSLDAIVLGTHAYSINLRSDNGYLEMRCACPVEEDECKHMYALMKYYLLKKEGIEVKEVSPFEDIYNRFYIAELDDYFDLGFEACRIYLEDPTSGGEVIAKNLKSFDYYSNRTFVPFALNERIYKDLMGNLNPDLKTRITKIRQRYLKAIEGRNYSFDDIVIANIFARHFETVFSYNIHEIYLSPLSRAGLIYAALHMDEITIEIAHILSKMNLKEKEVKEIFIKMKDKGSKKLFFMVYPQYFTDLSKEEIADLEYTVDDIYNSFTNATSLSMPKIITSNYKLFINKNREEYLPGMIMTALSYGENQRRSFLELYNIIESLSDNSLLLKIDYKGQKQTAETILKRWRGYDGRGFNDY